MNPKNFPALPADITADDYAVVLKMWTKMATAFQNYVFSDMDLERPVLMKDLIPTIILTILLTMSLYHFILWAKAKCSSKAKAKVSG